MNKTIWKFYVEDGEVLELPRGAQIVAVAEEGRNLVMWALVDPSAATVSRRFVIRGTGHPVEPTFVYVGTVPTVSGFVWHIFEEVA